MYEPYILTKGTFTHTKNKSEYPHITKRHEAFPDLVVVKAEQECIHVGVVVFGK